MLRILGATIAGLFFGAGLVLSGMSNPNKVLAFLDILGKWDPSLLFVMGGAIVTTFAGYRLVWQRGAPLTSDSFHLPRVTRADFKLLIGSAVFGIGWGLAGYCPGPALTALAFGGTEAWLFVAAMVAGFAASSALNLRKAQQPES